MFWDSIGSVDILHAELPNADADANPDYLRSSSSKSNIHLWALKVAKWKFEKAVSEIIRVKGCKFLHLAFIVHILSIFILFINFDKLESSEVESDTDTKINDIEDQ